MLNKSTSNRQISRAYTDAEGYIHPCEIIYHDKNGNIIKKTAVKNSQQEEFNIIDFTRDFSGTDLYGKSGDDIHFYISEGSVSLVSDAVFEFDFDESLEIDENTKFKKGDLKNFNYYLNTEADFVTKLALDMSKQLSKEKTIKLLDMKKITVKFMVGPVPVWISFDCDIYSHYEFNADASLHADWGFESNHTLKIGASFNSETDEITPITEYTPDNTIYPLNIDGEVNLDARLEIYPRIDMKFYSFFGPFAEVVPYVSGDYNATLQSQVTLSGPETFLAWDSGIDLGLDFRVGAELSFIGLINKEIGPATINCFEYPLWNSPDDIELLTTLPEETEAGSTITLKYKVTDKLDLPVALCPVYITGDGSFDHQLPLTNINGEVEVQWTVSSSEGEDQISASIYQADKTEIKQITNSVTVNDGGGGDGTVIDIDGNTYNTVIIGNQEWMAENLKVTHYRNNESISDCWSYNNDDSNADTYGRLYSWHAVDDSRNIAPAGWHVPTDEEWKQLEMALGMSESEADDYGWRGTNEGSKLADRADLWYDGALENDSEFGTSGFAALPVGYRPTNGNFTSMGDYTLFWSATENGSNNAWYRYLGYDRTKFGRNYRNKGYGYSVRCVRD